MSVTDVDLVPVWAALMDISLALLPWKILWSVQLRTPEKIGVLCAMSLGLLAGATAIIRCLYVQQLTRQDISYDAKDSIIWSATESAATIVAACIPILRKLLKDKVSSAVAYVTGSGGISGKRSMGKSRSQTQRSQTASAANAFSRKHGGASFEMSSPSQPRRTFKGVDIMSRLSKSTTCPYGQIDEDNESNRSILRETSTTPAEGTEKDIVLMYQRPDQGAEPRASSSFELAIQRPATAVTIKDGK